MFGVAESCQRHAISQPSGSDSDFRLIDCIPTFDSQTAHFCSPKLRRQSEEDLEGSPGLVLISRQPPECACPDLRGFRRRAPPIESFSGFVSIREAKVISTAFLSLMFTPP
jgi:hypothetical protein